MLTLGRNGIVLVNVDSSVLQQAWSADEIFKFTFCCYLFLLSSVTGWVGVTRFWYNLWSIVASMRMSKIIMMRDIVPYRLSTCTIFTSQLPCTYNWYTSAFVREIPCLCFFLGGETSSSRAAIHEWQCLLDPPRRPHSKGQRPLQTRPISWPRRFAFLRSSGKGSSECTTCQ